MRFNLIFRRILIPNKLPLSLLIKKHKRAPSPPNFPTKKFGYNFLFKRCSKAVENLIETIISD